MQLQEKIQQDLRASMKARTEAKTSALRVLIGEFQRQPRKEQTDTEVLSIIRKLIKSESEMLASAGKNTSEYLEVLAGYMPKQPSEDEIREWIQNNINLSEFKNKIQAMRPIMAHFAGAVDGSVVKKILEEV